MTYAPSLTPELLAVFITLPDLYLIVSPDLTILTASDAYLNATLKKRENIQGLYLFDVFPENPDLHISDGVVNLDYSLNWVLQHKKPHRMPVQRYDIIRQDLSEGFEEKYWLTVNTPVLDSEGNVQYIIHKVTDMTAQVQADRLLEILKRQTESQVETSKENEKAAWAEVQLQRNLLQALLNQAPVAMSLYQGSDQVIATVNPQMCSIWGRTPDQVLGKPLLEALPELKGQGFNQLIGEVALTGVPFVGKETPAEMVRNGSMETNYYNFVYQPLYDEHGILLGVFNVAVEVTELVEARKQVEESERQLRILNQDLEQRVADRTMELQLAKAEIEAERNRLQQIFMQSAAPICILSGEHFIYELVNPAYQQLLPNRQLLGNSLLGEALSELASHSFADTLREVYRTGQTIIRREELIPVATYEGGPPEERYFDYTLQARWNEQKQVDGIIIFAFDVTDQIGARKAVEQSAERLRLITDALPVLIGYLDKEEKYRFANQAYKSWFGLEPHQLLGRPVREVVGEKAYQGVKHYIDQALAGERLDFESRMPYREDFVKYIRTSYIPHLINGEVAGFYTLVSDITEQVESSRSVEESARQAKAMAEELSISNEQLMRINVDLDNFIYAASHDLKGPISNIEGLMQILIDSLPSEIIMSEEIEDVIDMIRHSIERFKRTIEHLTDVTKLQKENNQDAVMVDLQSVISEVVLDLNPQLKAADANLEIDVTACSSIKFSEKNLRSVIYNLISNSIKYSHPARKPQVKIRCYSEKEQVVLSVQDNGLGMDLSEDNKLFTMFGRLHDHVEGSGVGLYMVKRIIENAGGFIKVDSKVGVGTTFFIYLKP